MVNSEKNVTISSIGSLMSTLELKNIDGITIPFQNGIPYPSFDPQHRKVFSLEGVWKKKRFDADHDWTMSHRDSDWISNTEQASTGITSSIDFDDSTWEAHSVPLPENKLTGKEEVHAAETYQNGVWYRRRFFLDESWTGKVITLKSLGLSYIGDFWINGNYVGYHEGGYTPFAFDVTPFVSIGENTIVIRVDNPPWASRIDIIPAVENDFFNYTGIIQDIFIEATDGVQVVRTDIVPKTIKGDLDITVVVENRTEHSKSISLEGNIFETDFLSKDWLVEPFAKSICQLKIEVDGLLKSQIDLSPFETKVVNFKVSLKGSPKLWSIREPNLYVLEVLLSQNQVEIDSFYSQFGIRTITTDQSKICLNDEVTFLAGVARHEEWPEYGRTASWERIKQDFLQITDLSINMVRTAHYPNHIYTFIILDRLGITAMSEIPLWQFETHHYLAQEKRKVSYQMWREMIFSHYNRPSIIMWSTQNESKDVTLRKKYNERLVNEVRTNYNDGRLITQSSAADQPGFYDESMEPLDVAGWTMYFGIFHGSTPYEGTRDFIEKAHQQWPDKPIINTEYGIWSNADESYIEKQVEIYNDVQLALLEKVTVTPQGHINDKGYIAAIDYWTVYDWYVNHNDFYQTMGIYHMDRETKKPLYYRFLEDHKRLLGETNGIGKSDFHAIEQKIKIKEEKFGSGLTEYILEDPMNMSLFNYLSITVEDSQSSDGMTMQLRDHLVNSTSFQTYGIQVNQEFDVIVPIWKLNQDVLPNVTSIKLIYGQGRQLNILDITCKMVGSN